MSKPQYKATAEFFVVVNLGNDFSDPESGFIDIQSEIVKNRLTQAIESYWSGKVTLNDIETERCDDGIGEPSDEV